MVTAGMADVSTRQAMEAGVAGGFPKHSSLEQLAMVIHLESQSLRKIRQGRLPGGVSQKQENAQSTWQNCN